MTDADEKMIDPVAKTVASPAEETADQAEAGAADAPAEGAAGESGQQIQTEAVAEKNGDASTTTASTATTTTKEGAAGCKRDRSIKFDAALLPESNDPAEIRKQVCCRLHIF